MSKRAEAPDLERDALRRFLIRLSRRRVLWEGVALEVEAIAVKSVEEMIHDAEEARLALPENSRFDGVLAKLQDVCNRFRTDVERRPQYPFGESLYDLRVATLALTQIVTEQVGLTEADSLAAKIDPSTARSAMGPVIGISKDGVYTPVEVEDDLAPNLRAARARLLGRSPGDDA